MGHKVFIPITDELVFDRPDLISSPLRPYCESLACYHWLDIRLNPKNDRKIAESLGSRRNHNSREEDQYPQTVAA